MLRGAKRVRLGFGYSVKGRRRCYLGKCLMTQGWRNLSFESRPPSEDSITTANFHLVALLVLEALGKLLLARDRGGQFDYGGIQLRANYRANLQANSRLITQGFRALICLRMLAVRLQMPVPSLARMDWANVPDGK